MCSFSVPSELFLSLLLITLLLAPTAPIAALEAPTNPVVADELKQLNDEIIISTHVSLDSERDHFKDGAEKASWTLAGLWGWRVSDSQDWGIRFRLPFNHYRTD